MAKKIMAWRKCSIRIGKSVGFTMPTETLTSIGTIKDKSSTLDPEDGDTLEMKESGGGTVAFEESEGSVVLTTRVIEPTFDLLALLGLGEKSGDNDFDVKTHIVEGDWAVEVEPKNVGARGFRCPAAHVSYNPGWSEEDGNYAHITIRFLHDEEADRWYTMWTKQAKAAQPA